MPKRGSLKSAGKRQESATFLQRSFFNVAVQFSFAAAQLLVKMTSALQKSKCYSATSAAQHSENCSATSVFACGMLQGWGLEGWGLGLTDKQDSEGWGYGFLFRRVLSWSLGWACEPPPTCHRVLKPQECILKPKNAILDHPEYWPQQSIKMSTIRIFSGYFLTSKGYLIFRVI